MRRFYVVSVCDGAWEVRLQGAADPPHRCENQDSARRLAATMARLAWVDDGAPTGVKECSSNGQWSVIETFGAET